MGTRGDDDRNANDVVITPARGIQQGLAERWAVTGPLLWLWTRRELRVRYRQSALRAAWGLLQPLAILVTYGWVLRQVFDVSSDGVPYLTFAWAGIVPFTFFAQSLGLGVGSIQQAGGLISRVYFPREVLPLSVVGCSFVDYLVMVVIMLVLASIQVGVPGIEIIGLIPVTLVLVTWTAGLTVLAAAVTVFRRDLNHAMPLVLRILFIITPVMYSATLLPRAAPINPLTAIIEGTRDSLYRGEWPSPYLAVSGALGALVLVTGLFVLRRLEPRMGDVV